ncbi:hypothetical protein KVR01_000048 [Diaporthe batatas]|uniref:uncharacterized protein n=1 Tax=Diaporthe batatas TaxID=748121 RepID=UPI001D04C53A|nr:uncharacterized protein KVR01_000048 [Diaporthe batatas]KAG8169303.1 hypothetical protein KVR01_000048 [Diaporthe batatas]
MRATTTVLFIAGLAGTAFGAATKQFSDDKCQNEISKKVFNGFASGDAAIKPETVAIKVDAISDTWFAFQDNDGGDNCRGDLITRLDDDECIPVATLGIGCTRLCSGGLGGGDCASNEEPL